LHGCMGTWGGRVEADVDWDGLDGTGGGVEGGGGDRWVDISVTQSRSSTGEGNWVPIIGEGGRK
jgi:hypothetical protein